MERAAPTQQSEVIFCCPRESQDHCLRTLLVKLYDISSCRLQLTAEEFCNLIAASLWASPPPCVLHKNLKFSLGAAIRLVCLPAVWQGFHSQTSHGKRCQQGPEATEPRKQTD